MKIFKSIITLFLFLFLAFACNPKINRSENKASPIPTELYNTIAHLDSAMFDAFNNRDISGLQTFLSKELEFYHDLGGVTNYDQNIVSFKKTFASDRVLRRELVSGSMEVHPIKDFGAVQTGIHRFYVTENNQKEMLSSEAKFINLWQNKNDVWKITKIISYGHTEYLQ